MSRIRFPSRIVLRAVLAALALIPACLAGESNVLDDGGFETGNIAGWELADGVPGSVAEITRAKARTGRSALRISSPSDSIDAALVRTVHVKPDRYYKYCGYIATDDVSGGQLGANIGIFGSFDCAGNVTGTADWTYVEIFFKTHHRQKSIALDARLGMWGSTCKGTAYFDDLRVVELSKPPDAIIVTVGEPEPQSCEPRRTENGSSSPVLRRLSEIVARRPPQDASAPWSSFLNFCVLAIMSMRILVWAWEKFRGERLRALLR